MKSKTLWLTSGAPASGKTTFIKENLPQIPYVSRDEIRFSLIKDDEDYFAYENEVFREFVKKIQNTLDTEGKCVADATHLNERSRNKLLDRLNLDGVEIIVISFKTPLEVLLERNENRTGRSYVPRSVIRRMYYQFEPAHYGEKYEYKDIIIKE